MSNQPTQRIGNFIVLDLGTHKVYGAPQSLIRVVSASREAAEPCGILDSADIPVAVPRIQPLADQSSGIHEIDGNQGT